MCTVLLPPGDNPIAVNKYINKIHISEKVNMLQCTGNKIWHNNIIIGLYFKCKEEVFATVLSFYVTVAFSDHGRNYGRKNVIVKVTNTRICKHLQCCINQRINNQTLIMDKLHSEDRAVTDILSDMSLPKFSD